MYGQPRCMSHMQWRSCKPFKVCQGGLFLYILAKYLIANLRSVKLLKNFLSHSKERNLSWWWNYITSLTSFLLATESCVCFGQFCGSHLLDNFVTRVSLRACVGRRPLVSLPHRWLMVTGAHIASVKKFSSHMFNFLIMYSVLFDVLQLFGISDSLAN